MKTWMSRACALLEVVLVRFAAIPLLYIGINRLFPQLEAWQVQKMGFAFPVLNHALMAAVPLLVIAARRQDLVAYGMSFRKPRYHLDIAGRCFVPVVLASIPFGMGLEYTRWEGAILLAGIQIALLLVVGWLLSKKPSASETGIAIGGLVLLPGLAGAVRTSVGQGAAVFLTYALFVGFGEEIVYRGYIQSRLNLAFGRPYRLFGVQVGWGLIIASLLFGLTHVGILGWLAGGSTGLTWAWGFWTFFGGLVFGLVREKSGSILAPALLHGLPQAIASVAMLILS